MERFGSGINWFVVLGVTAYIILCLVWGSVTATMMHNKGYYDKTVKWFWIGAIFNVLGFAFACSEPDLNIVRLINELNKREEEAEKNGTSDRKLKKITLPSRQFKTVLPAKDWKCSCGRMNPSYVTTCLCGAEKGSASVDDEVIVAPIQ